MVTKKHTEGDWIITADGEANFSGICANGNWLMRIQQNGELSAEEQDANLKLIKSSPEVLKQLIKLQKSLDKLINITPTGNTRNWLCDLNIETLEVISKSEI